MTQDSQALVELDALMVEAPSEVQRIIDFLNRLSNGFQSVAVEISRLTEQNADFERSARMGLAAQHAEISDERRAKLLAEERSRSIVAVLDAVHRALSPVVPDGYQAAKIEDRVRAAEKILADYKKNGKM